jgi:hypothetical protein
MVQQSNRMIHAPDGLAFTTPAAWFSTMAACQREVLEFMSRRLERDGEAMREAIACRNIGDALAVQTRWLDETLRDYSDEATRLLALSVQGSESSGAAERRP